MLLRLLRGAWTEGLGAIHPVLRPARAAPDSFCGHFSPPHAAKSKRGLSPSASPGERIRRIPTLPSPATVFGMNFCLCCVSTTPQSRSSWPNSRCLPATRRRGGKLSSPDCFHRSCSWAKRSAAEAVLPIGWLEASRSLSRSSGFGCFSLRSAAGCCAPPPTSLASPLISTRPSGFWPSVVFGEAGKTQPGGAGLKLQMGRGLRAERTPRELRLLVSRAEASAEAAAPPAYDLAIPGTVDAPAFGLRLEAALGKPPTAALPSAFCGPASQEIASSFAIAALL